MPGETPAGRVFERNVRSMRLEKSFQQNGQTVVIAVEDDRHTPADEVRTGHLMMAIQALIANNVHFPCATSNQTTDR